MGAEQSSAATPFTAFYESLDDDVCDQIEALCAKDDGRLLKPHGSAPPPFPQVPIGFTVRLSTATAGAALVAVPRLQRKHYETIPKTMAELDFWISFFSHVTVIVGASSPEKIREMAGKADWKGNSDVTDGADSFTAMWNKLPESQRAALAALVAKESDAVLLPASAAPPPFPQLPIGMECFIDEAAATAALTLVPGLQRKHSMLVPKKLDERSFWVNFLSHATVVARDSPA